MNRNVRTALRSTLSLLMGASVALKAYADDAAFGKTSDMVEAATDLVDMLIVLAVGIAVLVFFWGLVKFIGSAAGSKDHSSGRNLMVWGTIALFVIATVGGLIKFIQGELGIDAETIDVPEIDDGGGAGG